MKEVFTPLNEDSTERLEFPMEDVNILKGSLLVRELGHNATVEIKGDVYEVYGKACDLENCHCDAYIKPIKK